MDDMSETLIAQPSAGAADPFGRSPVRHDHLRRIVIEFAGVDLLLGRARIHRRRTQRDRAFARYSALLAVKPAA
jgi:hypothetical protein